MRKNQEVKIYQLDKSGIIYTNVRRKDYVNTKKSYKTNYEW